MAHVLLYKLNTEICKTCVQHSEGQRVAHSYTSLLNQCASDISTIQDRVPSERTTSPPPKKKRPVGTEIQDYLSTLCIPESNDILQYLEMNQESDPTLGKLATKCFGIPSSSAAAERPFSTGWKIFRPDLRHRRDVHKNNSHFDQLS